MLYVLTVLIKIDNNKLFYLSQLRISAFGCIFISGTTPRTSYLNLSVLNSQFLTDDVHIHYYETI